MQTFEQYLEQWHPGYSRYRVSWTLHGKPLPKMSEQNQFVHDTIAMALNRIDSEGAVYPDMTAGCLVFADMSEYELEHVLNNLKLPVKFTIVKIPGPNDNNGGGGEKEPWKPLAPRFGKKIPISMSA